MKTKIIIGTIIILSIGVGFVCTKPVVNKLVTDHKIGINNTQIEYYQEKYIELEDEQQKLHDKAEILRLENKQLINTKYIEGNEEIMNLICERSPNSPMCDDYVMLNELKEVASDVGVDYKLLLGIMMHESHIGASFAPHYGCRVTKNRAGLKREKRSDGTVSEKYNEQYENLDKYTQEQVSGCYLYYYETNKQFFKSLANTIKLGYIDRGGDTPEKIVNSYVGNYSQNRVDTVNSFYLLK